MDANNLEEFRAGVSACLRSWSALRTAVESGWGGGDRESQNKAEGLRQSIFETLNGSKFPLPNYDEQDLAGKYFQTSRSSLQVAQLRFSL